MTASIFSGPSDQPDVALTFDDGPHPKFTPRLLDILKKHNINATFFVLAAMSKNIPTWCDEPTQKAI
jgi:peptidoglycan/xylan/chitin deacetylase (PgdA/CDA1 family)